MTPAELKAYRNRLKVPLIELAAYTGLPSGYLAKIEEREVIPLERDLQRMERALRTLERNRLGEEGAGS